MLTLIIGGSGSGKSAFAEALVRKLTGDRIYLATMAAADGESLCRIARHRRQRETLGFVTLEQPLRLWEAAVPAGANVLLEDLSNLLANEMFSPAGGGVDAVRRGLEHLTAWCGNLTVVTNEVFSGGAEYEGDTLSYIKELAALNRRCFRPCPCRRSNGMKKTCAGLSAPSRWWAR